MGLQRQAKRGERIAGRGREDKLRYIMAHPMRYRIIKLLMNTEPMYVTKIAKKLKIGRKLVSYHLLTLLQHGIVTGKYDLRGGPPADKQGRPIVVRYYSLTEEARRILSRF